MQCRYRVPSDLGFVISATTTYEKNRIRQQDPDCLIKKLSINVQNKITSFKSMVLKPLVPRYSFQRCRRGPNACPLCGGTGSVIDADGEAESCECINGADGSCRWCVVHGDVCFN